MSDKFLDVEKVIRDKNPKLLKYMPGFMVRYIKRIIHQEELNSIIEDYKDLYGYDFCVACLERFNIKVEVEGIENIPKQGGVVFAGNHPFGGLEALAHVKAIHPIRPDVKFIVNDILMNISSLKDLFVGVNKHGSTSKRSKKELNELFEGKNALFIYPSGLVSRRIDGKVQDLPWRKSFITRSKSNDSQIVPVFTGGAELSSFFYNLSNLRTNLGLKVNFEMFYLVDEMMKQKNSTFRVVFGKPIPTATFDASRTDQEWCEWVREKVYILENQ